MLEKKSDFFWQKKKDKTMEHIEEASEGNYFDAPIFTPLSLEEDIN